MTNYKPLRILLDRSKIVKAIFTITIVLIGIVATAQHVSTTDGPWNSSITWGGMAPPTSASGTITINHNVTIPTTISVTADEVTIGAAGSLTVNSGGTFILADGTGTDLIVSGALSVSGLFTCNNLATLSGTTAGNTNFLAGSEYRHEHTSHTSVIPTATWNVASTLNITSFTTGGTINGTSTFWSQNFGNVTFNCPALGAGVNFNGLLRNIGGNFNLLNTGGSHVTGAKLITLASSAFTTIAIGGSFTISGHSNFTFGVTGSTITYNIGQDFSIATTTTTPAGLPNIPVNLTSFGSVNFNIGRDFIVNMPAAATLNLTGGAAFSPTFDIKGNFTFTSGTMTEGSSTSNKPVFQFSGTTPQTFSRGASSTLPSGISVTQIDWILNAGSTLNTGTSVISSGTGSTTTINGTLGVGSLATGGALQNTATATSGNIQTGGTRNYASTSVIVYNGLSQQVMTNVHNVSGMDVVINNSAGVVQNTGVVIGGDLTLSAGNLAPGNSNSLTVNGNLSLPSGNVTTGNIVMGTNATLTLNGNSSNHANNYVSLTSSTNLSIGGSNAFGVFPFQTGSSPAFGSFTLARTSGSVTFANDVTINGNTTLTTGNLIFTNQDLTLAGAFSAGTGRLFSSGGSTLEATGFSNTGVLMFDAVGNVLSALLVNKQSNGTSVTVGSPIVVTSSVDLFGGILDNNSGITLADGVVVTRDSDSEMFVAGFTNNPGDSYDVIYIGSDPYTTGFELPTDAVDLNNLTINGGPVTLDQNITINGIMSLDLGELNTVSSNITMAGPSWEANGAIFDSGSGLVIFPSSTLVLGDATPQFGNIQINATGNVTLQSTDTNVSGNFLITAGGQLSSPQTIVLNGAADQNIGMSSNSIYNMTVNKTPGTNVFLVSPMDVTGLLNILSVNTDFYSDDNMTIISTDDNNFGIQAIGVAPLPSGSTVEGQVSVQRYMSGEGRIWRYISSPITDGNVQDLKDNFPVTGTFSDPSTGTGLNSTTPSLYFYNETALNTNLQIGWTAYPSSGLAQAAPLIPGRGYSPFIREAAAPTVWTLTGPINQGDVPLPVTFSSTPSATADGWNLVGNPYPCSIFWGREGDLGEDPEGWTRENVRNAIAIRENSFSDENFLVWDGELGDFSGDIAIGQAFWVQTTAASPSLIIHETAKSFTNGAFYRKSEIDYVQIQLTKDGSYKDRLYIRQRNNSNAALDNYDAPKMSNGYYTLAVKSSDNVNLAISAVPSVVCGGKMALDLSFAKNTNGTFVKSPAGQYKLFANQFGLYGSQTITLTDKFTGTVHTFQPDVPYVFTITAAAQSYRADRFELNFNESIPATNLTVNAPNVACTDPSIVVVVGNAQADIEYQAFMNGVAITAPVAGEGNNLDIAIANESLALGSNVISVKALNGCSAYELASTVTIKKAAIFPVQSVASTEVCQEGSVTLTASGVPDGGVYRWYGRPDATTPLYESADAAYVTGVLNKPETFYVAVTNDLGCEGPRMSVKANVVKFNDAVISSSKVNELKSNYAEGNVWYLNGVELPEHDQVIEAHESGVYRLEVSIGACLTIAEQEYIVTGEEENANFVFGVYPNPVDDILAIQGDINPESVRMLSGTGSEMKIQWVDNIPGNLRLWVGDLQAGIYYVTARQGNKRKSIKVIRK